nr:MAG TPA: hypothetical protein [Caudoviricetes sp.]
MASRDLFRLLLRIKEKNGTQKRALDFYRLETGNAL